VGNNVHDTTLTLSKTQTRTNNNYVSHKCDSMYMRQNKTLSET